MLIAFGAAILVFAALRLGGATGYTLWSDEVFSLRIAEAGWPQLLPAVARDIVHPPLFYAVLKVWTGVGGESLLWLRLLPILTSLAALVPFLLLSRQLDIPPRAALLAVLLAAPNVFLIDYAQQVRMYALLVLLTLCSQWLFVGYWRATAHTKGAWLAGLTGVNLLLVYTQYYGWVVVLGEVAFLLLFDRRRLGPLAISTALVAAAFLPWATAVVREAAALGGLKPNLGWMRRPDLRDLVAFFAGLHGPYRRGPRISPMRVVVGCVLFAIPAALLMARAALSALRPSRTPMPVAPSTVAWLAFFGLGPVAVSFAASRILSQPVFEARHLLIAAMPYLLLCAVAAIALTPRAVRLGWIGMMVAWAGLGAVEGFRDRDKVSWGELVERISRSGACNAAALETPRTLYVIGATNAIALPIRYYLERAEGSSVDGASVQLIPGPEKVAGRSAWLAYQESAWGGWSAPRIHDALAAAGYRIACDFASGTRDHLGHVLWLEADTASARVR